MVLKFAHFRKQIKNSWELWIVVLEVNGDTYFVQLCRKWRSTVYSQEENNSLPKIDRRKCNLVSQTSLRSCLIVLCGRASNSNIAMLQRYQSKILRLITNAPWYAKNQILHTDLQIPFVHTLFQDHIRKHLNTLETRPNPLVEPILHSEHSRKLKGRWSFDATNWGNVDGRSPRSLTQLPAR